MKKIFAIVLCVVFCLCMAVPAFAADGEPEATYPGQTGGADVKITITGEVVHVYLVDIEFNDITFVYNSDGYKWNPNDYQYEHNTNGTWTGEGNLKIINHSDKPVTYKVETANVSTAYGPLSINLAGSTDGTIDACTVGTTKGSKNAVATYTVSGTPTVTSITAQKLGEIKVTISK